MNSIISTLPNGDFKIDPILSKAREEAMEKHDVDYEPKRNQ